MNQKFSYLTRPDGLRKRDSMYPVRMSDLQDSELLVVGVTFLHLRAAKAFDHKIPGVSHLPSRWQLPIQFAGVRTRRKPQQMKRIPANCTNNCVWTFLNKTNYW